VLVGYPEEYKQQLPKSLYLNQIIIERLMLQEAEKERITTETVTDADLKSSLSTYMKFNGLDAKTLAENLVAKNLTIIELQDYFRKQLVLNNFLNKTLFKDMAVTEDDIKSYYDKNSEGFNAQEGQIRARHILVATKEEAESILAKLKNGSKFAVLAAEY
jgi:foldase protein PrsA